MSVVDLAYAVIDPYIDSHLDAATTARDYCGCRSCASSAASWQDFAQHWPTLVPMRVVMHRQDGALVPCEVLVDPESGEIVTGRPVQE